MNKSLIRSPLVQLFKNPMRVIAIVRIGLLWYRSYFGIQKITDHSRAQIMEVPMDDRITPDEQAIYPYLFACVYILYIGWYVLDKLSHDQYQRAFKAYTSMIKEAAKVFSSNPSRMIDRQRNLHPLLQYVQTIDGPTNCYPSLHVGLVTLSYQIMKDNWDSDPLILAAMRKSCIDICRSTLKTKQHSIIDVTGGLTLADRTYREHFTGNVESLLPEIFPELDEHETHTIEVARIECPDLTSLMKRLLIDLAPPVARHSSALQ